jgi:2-iminobutanoate/2-iminopropanoate deaminase
MKRVITSDQAASPRGAYSQGWRAGDFIFVSGQVPRDPSTGDVLQGPIKKLVVRTLMNIEAILKTEGASLNDVVKFTVIVKNMEFMSDLNAGFLETLKNPLPARTTFQGDLQGVPIEIDAIAYLDPKQRSNKKI